MTWMRSLAACLSSSAFMIEKPTGPRLLVWVRFLLWPPSCTRPLRSMPCPSSQPTASRLSACRRAGVRRGCAGAVSGDHPAFEESSLWGVTNIQAQLVNTTLFVPNSSGTHGSSFME